MLYSEETLCKEIQWEYSLPKWKILRLIDNYKARGEYELLCRSIEQRNTNIKKECQLCFSILGQ